MLAISNMLDETSLVVENMFLLELVKAGFIPPQALADAFANKGENILTALEREDEDYMTGDQDILEFLNESEQSGWLIEVRMPSANDFCFDSSGALVGYNHDFATQFNSFFYGETLGSCIGKAVGWHDAYINEQAAAQR